MKTPQSLPSRPSHFRASASTSTGRVAWLLAALLLLGSIPAMATINVMTNNAASSIGSDTNWSLASSPNSGSAAGSYTDGLLASTDTSLRSGSSIIHLQSWNVTNGNSYTIVVSNASSTILRFGENLITNAVPNGTNDQPFVNPFSGGTSDLIFLTNNSSLTIYNTNAGTGGALTNQMRQNGNFNISPGSTLTIASVIAAGGSFNGSSGKLYITGGGTFNFNGTNSGGWSGTMTASNCLMNLNGGIINANLTVDSTNAASPTLIESASGVISGLGGSSTTLLINNGIAELHGVNTYTGITKVVGTLNVFGASSLSAASTLNSGGSTGDNSVLNLATAGNGYTMNQLSLGGIMRFSGPSSGSATITFTNGGVFTGGAVNKIINVSNAVTVVVNGVGTNFNLMGPTAATNRDLHFDVYGSGSLIFNVPITDVTTNATAIANGNIAGISLYQTNANGLVVFNGNNNYRGPTANNGATLLINGDSSAATNTVTVATNATLGGSGKIGGATTLDLGANGTNLVGSKLTFTNGLTLNGNTMYVGTSSALGAGDYVLWTNTAAAITGSFNATPVIGGAGINGTGTIVTTNNNAVILHVVAASAPLKFGSISKSGTTLTLTAVNGSANGPWTLLQSTNVTKPLNQWETNRTGFYDGGGSLTTNILNTATNPVQFYILK